MTPEQLTSLTDLLHFYGNFTCGLLLAVIFACTWKG